MEPWKWRQTWFIIIIPGAWWPFAPSSPSAVYLPRTQPKFFTPKLLQSFSWRWQELNLSFFSCRATLNIHYLLWNSYIWPSSTNLMKLMNTHMVQFYRVLFIPSTAAFSMSGALCTSLLRLAVVTLSIIFMAVHEIRRPTVTSGSKIRWVSSPTWMNHQWGQMMSGIVRAKQDKRERRNVSWRSSRRQGQKKVMNDILMTWICAHQVFKKLP